MKKTYKLVVFLTGFFSIIFPNFSALQAGLLEPTRSLKATVDDPGQLTVSSEPPGLSIKLDGTFVGQTPMRINAVDPGTHQLQIGKSVTEVYVEPDQTFYISLFKSNFIQFQVPKKETVKPYRNGNKLTSPTPAAEPSSEHFSTKEENRKAWERWKFFVNGSSNHF